MTNAPRLLSAGALLALFLLIAGCGSGSDFSGTVEDLYLGESPGEGVAVTALATSTRTLEKNRLELRAVTNAKGEFKLRGAVPGKTYSIEVDAPAFWRIRLERTAPARGKTDQLGTLYVLRRAPITEGVYVPVDYESQDWAKLPLATVEGRGADMQTDVRADRIPLFTGSPMIVVRNMKPDLTITGKLAPLTGYPGVRCEQDDRGEVEIPVLHDAVMQEGDYRISVTDLGGTLDDGVWGFPEYATRKYHLFRVCRAEAGGAGPAGATEGVPVATFTSGIMHVFEIAPTGSGKHDQVALETTVAKVLDETAQGAGETAITGRMGASLVAITPPVTEDGEDVFYDGLRKAGLSSTFEVRIDEERPIDSLGGGPMPGFGTAVRFRLVGAFPEGYVESLLERVSPLGRTYLCGLGSANFLMFVASPDADGIVGAAKEWGREEGLRTEFARVESWALLP